MKKAKACINSMLNMGVFRIVCMIYVVLNVIPTYTQPLQPFMKLFHVYAVVVLLKDLFTNQRCIRNKGRGLQVVFLLSSVVTYLLNPNLLNFSGISDFLYFVWYLLLIYSYDEKSKKEMLWFNRIIATLITVMNLVGMYMFFIKYIYFMPGGHIGMYPHENRLCGLFVNPNVLSAMSYGGIALAWLCYNKNNKFDKILGITGIVVNFSTLIMANSRSYIIGLSIMAAVLVFGFLWEKGKKFRTRAALAVCAAILVLACCILARQCLPIAEYIFDEVQYRVQSVVDYVVDLLQSIASPGGSQGRPTRPGKRPIKDKTDLFGRDPTTKLNGRIDIWSQAIRLIKNQWVFGAGLNNHQVAANRIGEEFELSLGGILHCVYLDLCLAFGLSGFLIIGAFVLLIVGNVRKYFKYCPDSPERGRVIMLISLIAGFAVAGIVDSMILFSMYPVGLLWWTLVAQLVQTVEMELKDSVHYRPEFLGMVWDGIFRKKKRDSKKICFVIDSLGGGGAERVLLDVTRALVNRGMDITVVTLKSGGELEEKLEPSVCLQTLDPFDLPLLKRVLHWVNRHCMPKRLYNFLLLDGRFDYTVAFLEGLSTILVADTHIKAQDKKYAWVHIDLKNQNWVLPFYQSLEAEIQSYHAFDKVFCVSGYTRDAFVEVIGCEDIAEVQYNLMDVDRIKALGKENCPIQRPEGILLCAIGRLNDQKGFDRLIPICVELKKQGFDITLWIVGEGVKRAQLEAQIAKLGAEGYIKLLGFQDNPYCYAAQADVFVLSSRAEGFGLVVMENLLLGKPVVATDCAGIVEQLGNDVYGIVTENEYDALKHGLERMLQDENLRAHYAVKARERAAELSYESQVQQFVDIFSA